MSSTSRDRTLVVQGPPGAGKAMIIGAMLFKYGGIDMMTMQKLEEGHDRYDQASKRLKSLKITPRFDTPGRHNVVILDHESDECTREADCTIFVVSPDTLPQADQYPDLSVALRCAKELIVLVNKMDSFDWSGEQFRKVANHFTAYLESNGVDVAKVPIIPVSALHGDNLVESSPKCTWYDGWAKESHGESKSGKTLLEALDTALEAQ